ncbi:MAG: hypothetical protein OXC71_03950 [Chloroflexi bacterium]|nr:hypothetical protein [Chloroflexota bacterium]
MGVSGVAVSIRVGSLRSLKAVTLCVLVAATLLACTDEGDSADEQRVREFEARADSLEESVDALADENAALRAEVLLLRQELADLEARESGERLDDLDTRLQAIEELAFRVESILFGVEWRSEDEDKSPALTERTALERTVELVQDSGGVVQYVEHPAREPAVLVTPQTFVDGETPLIVALHGYGSDSASLAAYVPLHERVATDGFALLLPNGTRDSVGNPFWNPTDECCAGGKTGEDDVAYLTELVAAAEAIADFGPVYVFGYSNGGFMSHHMACKGLPGLRAVASLAGTSYVEDSSCEGAPPVSVLHIHGTEDPIILFDGDEETRDSDGDGELAFYAGAWDMATRWGRLAGCDWPDEPRPYATLDLDQFVPGSETQAFRLESGCADGVKIELWASEGSGHGPGYGDAFVDALLEWLLSQE